ncbi:MAG: histidine--tRNA ligase [Bacteroidota bacterium]|jgi:histidyl-tRNA synthetase|nr:histidine--tRNA ligase [Bacteroidia bacterium]MBP6009771.1 histidine--tRNA ligase [Bacteroidia bacterium]MBP7269439.1 histidine--tRNA ligase [Bacteroidia bacterium]MBP7436643.1 histidine--tRNA ligase [Bacteroidia bacterium]MBP7773003.1 histidine--tRNA ligase [Bacteroidia bacterium]
MKPSLPKGTRDFSPDEMLRRAHIFDTIRTVYQRYGFLPIETPAMENLSTLEGKYGEEGDKLLFRVLNSGPVLDQVKAAGSATGMEMLTEKGLRYDLTVPFARYVVMHQHELTFPFRRYQIQPVWRADRPQKGRYREFYQCDADVIGSDSLLNEVDLINIIHDVFDALELGVKILLNNRKVLSGIAGVLGEQERIIDITVAIDKLDKIGLDKVNEELKGKGVSETAITRLRPLMELKGSNGDKLETLRGFLAASETGRKGIEELEQILSYLPNERQVEIDITLARGLNYYTGAIIEVKVNDNRSAFTSSICGGGRYDDLTGIFGLKGVSGVGISFGADRIYDVLEEIKGFPDFSTVSTRVLFANFGEAEARYCLGLLQRLRNNGINAELYPDAAKMKKQLAYADARKIPYVALVGTEEMKNGQVTLKDMQKGEQSTITFEELLHVLK